MLRIATQAPDFEVRTQTGLRFRLSDHAGKRNVVLFFFPGHTRWQGMKDLGSFAQHLRDIQNLGGLLIGISNATPESLSQLSDSLGVPVLFGSDQELAVCRNYRVLWLRSKGVRRVTYVIDKHRLVRGVAHHELLLERHWSHVRRVLTQLREEEEIALYNRKALNL